MKWNWSDNYYNNKGCIMCLQLSVFSSNIFVLCAWVCGVSVCGHGHWTMNMQVITRSPFHLCCVWCVTSLCACALVCVCVLTPPNWGVSDKECLMRALIKKQTVYWINAVVIKGSRNSQPLHFAPLLWSNFCRIKKKFLFTRHFSSQIN